jgi:hypothetical protein
MRLAVAGAAIRPRRWAPRSTRVLSAAFHRGGEHRHLRERWMPRLKPEESPSLKKAFDSSPLSFTNFLP